MLFNPQRRFDFSSFESRKGSVHARAAAARFATRKGIVFGEPILILAGRTGAGKTHLLNATANLAKSNEYIHSSSTLSAHRMAEEVQRAIEYGDLPWLLDRFGTDDFLAIDDVDDLFSYQEAEKFLLKVLEIRVVAKRRTLLSATLSTAGQPDCALNTFLNDHVAVSLI
jgi:chromosomal replication initiation ATPase DnaA